jgi:hypothetical protein
VFYDKKIEASSFSIPPIESAQELSSYFLAFQFLLDTPYEDQLHAFYEQLSQYLDREEKIYIGPLIKEKYDNARPKPTLLEAIFFDNHFESSLLFYTPLINANAIFPLKERSLNSFRYQYHEWDYHIIHQCKLHLLKKYDCIENEPYLGLHLMRVLGEDGISLALFPGQFSTTATVAHNKVELAMSFDGPISDDEEISFFLTKDEKVKIFVNDKRASAFSINDDLSIFIGNQKLLLNFSVEEGNGLFFGSLSFGSRPCEDNKNLFLGVDWIISVRFTKRTENLKCKLVMELLPEEMGNQ